MGRFLFKVWSIFCNDVYNKAQFLKVGLSCYLVLLSTEFTVIVGYMKQLHQIQVHTHTTSFQQSMWGPTAISMVYLDGNDGSNVKLNITTAIPIDDYTLTWKRFLLYWPFVTGIHQWLVDSPHKAPAVNSSLVSLNNLLNKQWGKQWFKMPWCSCDITVTWKISIDFQLIRPSLEINECPRSTLTWHI